jgi:hypothetical protein
MVREKMVINEFERLALIDGRRPEYFWMRGGHGGGARVWA